MRNYLINKKSALISAFILIMIIVFSFSQYGATILALSPEQKLLYDKAIMYADYHGCSGLESTPEAEDDPGASGGYEYVSVGDIPKSGKEVGASIYGGGYTGDKWKPSNGQQGGGADDTGIGNHDNPLPGTTSYAELSTGGGSDYSALGGLPNGTKLEITYKGKSIVAEKADVGSGGGDVKGKPRAIDLWWEVVRLLDPEGKTDLSSGVDVVKVRGVKKSTAVTPITGTAGAESDEVVEGQACCGAGENADTSLSGGNNNAKALNFFVSKGFSPHQAAGIVGNFIEESGGYNNGVIDPQVVEGGGRSKTVPPPTGPAGQPGYGIAQWTFPTRKENLKKFAAEKKMPVYSLKLQLEFVLEEMTEDLEKELKKIKGSNRNTIEEAALLFHRVYEGSADSAAQIQERVSSGVEVLEQSGGRLSASGTEDSGSGECAISGASTGEMVWPVEGPLSSCYGVLPSRGRLHTGLDIASPTGSKVIAADGGKVADAGNLDPAGFGNTVIIDHGNGKATLYAHLSKISVSKGDGVDQGQKIGESGGAPGSAGAGSSRGPHLHFNVQTEATTGASDSNTLNPLSLLPDDGRQMRTGDGLCVPGEKGFK